MSLMSISLLCAGCVWGVVQGLRCVYTYTTRHLCCAYNLSLHVRTFVRVCGLNVNIIYCQCMKCHFSCAFFFRLKWKLSEQQTMVRDFLFQNKVSHSATSSRKDHASFVCIHVCICISWLQYRKKMDTLTDSNTRVMVCVEGFQMQLR